MESTSAPLTEKEKDFSPSVCRKTKTPSETKFL